MCHRGPAVCQPAKRDHIFFCVHPHHFRFFLRFKPGGSFPNGTYHVPACTHGVCSPFYHDQEQTPEHPTKSDPHPDGVCKEQCDCGNQPCGEYLWDHRNGTMLREFLVNEFVMGPTGVGSPAIDGLFIDDYWCSLLVNSRYRFVGSRAARGILVDQILLHSHSCSDPVQGPSEINRYSQVDMGLSDEDIKEITLGWLETMTAAQEAMVQHKAYTWSLIPGQANANASPIMVTPSNCLSMMRQSCPVAATHQRQQQQQRSNQWQDLPLLMGLTPGQNITNALPDLQQQVAAFLLLRGPHAFIGWGQWGMTWPTGASWTKQPLHGHGLPLPPALKADYGTPQAACVETSAGSGIFTRSWSKASVTLNCAAWTASIVTKSG